MPTALKREVAEIKKEAGPSPVKAREITPREREVLRLAALGLKTGKSRISSG